MRKSLMFAAMTICGVAAMAFAQPPEGGDRGPGGPGGRGGRPVFPLLAALDPNSDGEISAEEIKGAEAALKSLDKNGDGKLAGDEIRPSFGGRGPRGEGDRPRGEGRRGDGERGPGGPGGEGRRGPPSPEDFANRALENHDADKDGKLSKEELQKMAEGFGRGRGGPRGERGGPGGGDRPERPDRPE